MSEDKTKILFEQINLDLETRNKLKNMSLDKVKVNEKNATWTFVLKYDSVLDIEDYIKLEELGNHAFKNIKKVYFEIVPKFKDLTKLEDYYNYALSKLKNVLVFSDIFNNRLDVHNMTVEVVNIEEEKQLNEILPKINSLLNLYGFDVELSIYLNIDDNDIKDVINKDLSDATKNVVVSTPQVAPEKKDFTKFKRRPKIEDDKENPNVVVGRVIETKPTSIKNLVGEQDDVTVEGYVF